MHNASYGCHCGNIEIDVELTAAPGAYRPRVCDCDFCRKHGAAWLSDDKGSLLIRIKDWYESGTYRQGSKQAEFLLCRNCGVLIVVLYRVNLKLHAAINVKVFDSTVKFGAEQAVSPKQLSADEKANRWQDIWFSNVRIQDAVTHQMPISGKRYFTIVEAIDLCGVKRDVLRRWERDFPELQPVKRPNNRRYYRPQDLGVSRRTGESRSAHKSLRQSRRVAST